jgi:hypothetical protein
MKNYDLIRQQAWKRIEAHRAQKQSAEATTTKAPANKEPADDFSKLTYFDSREALMEHLLKAR